jgi:hypothetical protein
MKTSAVLWTVAAACCSSAWAADGLNIRTGLWQMTYRMQIRGAPTVPRDVTDKLTAEQRARLAAAQQKSASQGPKTWTEKTCVTAKDLQDGAFRVESSDAAEEEGCSDKMTARTATLQEGTTSCDGGKTTGQIRVEVLGKDRVQGRITTSGPGVSSTIEMSGQWLSTSCAGAED